MKFIYGYFDKNTGKSTVILSDRYGEYIGQAKLHPNDKKYASEFTGCSIAQARAQIKMLQKRRNYLKIKLEAIKNLIKDIEINYPTPLDDYKLKRRFNLQIKNYTNEIVNINNSIKDIQIGIKKRIEIKDKLNKQLV